MNGAPANPMRGTSSSRRRRRMASRVKPSDSRGSTGRSRSTSLPALDRSLDPRPLARGEGERNAERLERNEEVGEENRGIEAELCEPAAA